MDLLSDPRFVRALALGLHAQAERDVVEHRHVAEQRVMLEHEPDVAITHVVAGHIFAMEHDAAVIRGFQAGNDAQQGGLATA